MRILCLLPCSLLLLLLGCSGVAIERAPVDEFAAADYRYYKWRSKALPASRSSDPLYQLDPVVRREVDRILGEKGYLLDPQRAEFSVSYLFAMELREGEKPEQASNITPIPRAIANRQVDQAMVDNAVALGGVKETSNVVLQFHDVDSQRVVWQANMSKIIENANRVDDKALSGDLPRYLARALAPLPAVRSDR